MDYSFEQDVLDRNDFRFVAGCDEAGRGSLAGPIVAGAVIFDKNIISHKGFCRVINDSKKLSPKKRSLLYDFIIRESLAWSVGVVDHESIDLLGIGEANRLVMRLAIENLSQQPEYIVSDFVHHLQFHVPYDIMKKADTSVLSVAAASIIAKVFRDRLMEDYDKTYPIYGFSKHKGYGTKYHCNAISEYGLCPIHRSSFTLSFV